LAVTVDCNESDLVVIPGGIAGFQAAIADYLPYEIESAEGGDTFYSAGASCQIGGMMLSRLYASAAYSGFRAPSRRNDFRHSYLLVLKEAGGGVSFHSRRSCAIDAGQFILLDSRDALESRQHASGSSLMLSVPARALASRYANVDDWCLAPIDGETGAATVLRECILCYWRARRDMNASETYDLLAGLIHLIGAAFKSHGELPAFESQIFKMHFLRIRQLVAQNLEDPDLSTDFVADRLGLSKSYLYEIMRAAKTTLGRFIVAARLDRSREILADPAMASRSISDIAYSVGFQDLSHFSRRFSERFHCSPRDFRAASQRL
jgi:AraC family transcriptional activator of tynA and feaB